MVSELSTLVHNLVLDNAIPAKDLARAIEKPYSTLLREVNPYDTGAKLGADTLLSIMSYTGNVKPLEHMANKMGLKLVATKDAVPHVTLGAFQQHPDLIDSATCPVCGYLVQFGTSDKDAVAHRRAR